MRHRSSERGHASRPIMVKISTMISKCYHECPYFGLDGGPGPAMCCNHPVFANANAAPYSGFIISHPDCDDGFPELCPLINMAGAQEHANDYSQFPDLIAKRKAEGKP